MTNPQVQLDYFSDTLCVWAYVSQVRLDEVRLQFPDQVRIENHLVTLFGNTEQRIDKGWQDRGGYAGFADHVLEVCAGFPQVTVNPGIWRDCVPKSSAPSHLFIKAVQLLQANAIPSKREHDKPTIADQLAWEIRCAFFAEARDIGKLSELMAIAEQLNIPRAPIESILNSGEAFAALCSDMAEKETYKLDGSPTYLLNQGRQKLYGNVGYKIIEANINELLEIGENRASWC